MTEEPSSEEYAKKNQQRNKWLSILAAIFLLAGLGWFIYWLFIGRFYVYTEDAYVNGNQVMLTPQVGAGVKAIYADETDLVKKGQLVVELDHSDYELAYEQAKDSLANTVRQVDVLFKNVKAKEAQVEWYAAQLFQARLDLFHRNPLVKTGAVSLEEYETYQTNVEVADAKLNAAEAELAAAKALVEGTTVRTHPQVLESIWKLKVAFLNLIRCQVWAPVTGFVAKRSVQVGDRVNIGDTLLFIVPLDYIWLEANYKETQLRNVRIGQPVTYTADIYGGAVQFHGSVIGLQPGSGNAFSLLPSENASGNWIKIIQRVPVRISVDPDEILEHPLLLGLSMRVTVNIHDTQGKMLAQVPTMEPIYTTPIYTTQIEEMEEIDPLIEDIITNNSSFLTQNQNPSRKADRVELPPIQELEKLSPAEAPSCGGR